MRLAEANRREGAEPPLFFASWYRAIIPDSLLYRWYDGILRLLVHWIDMYHRIITLCRTLYFTCHQKLFRLCYCSSSICSQYVNNVSGTITAPILNMSLFGICLPGDHPVSGRGEWLEAEAGSQRAGCPWFARARSGGSPGNWAKLKIYCGA